MEVNKEEAIRCLHIAQKHRAAGNWPSARKFAAKSIALFPTPEGSAMVALVEREAAAQEASGGDSSTGASSSRAPPPPTGARPAAGSSSSARATGVEDPHVSSAHQRHAKKEAAATASASDSDSKGKKREYTVKQLEVVTRIRKCREYEYYEILAIQKTCTENEVKKAYKKLALALHPDKNGAPGADEAFKMVSKAFQVLSDGNLRSVYDMNPTVDPTQRGGGGGGGGGGMSGMRGFNGGGHPGFHGGGFQGEMNPEDLFNMFFGGGGGMNSGFGGSPFGARVYTFGGRGGRGGPQFAGRRAREQAAGGAQEPQSPFLALLPVLLLFMFLLFSVLPGIFSGDLAPDPEYRFAPSSHYDMSRTTWQRSVPYHVNKAEWESSNLWQSVPETRRDRLDAAMFSSKLRGFERDVEETHIRQLQADCHNFNVIKQRKIAEETGLFGWGADYDKIRKIRAEKHPSCDKLRSWGKSTQAF